MEGPRAQVWSLSGAGDKSSGNLLLPDLEGTRVAQR